MTEQTFDWRSFLVRWSEDWAGTCTDPAQLREDDVDAWRARWLGFDAAPPARVAAAEAALGCVLPPSYREFLAVSDGWRHAGGFVHRLAGTAGARWHRDAWGVAEYFDEGELAGMWERALQLDVESDLTLVLLDPGDVDEDGEWAVYCYASWRAAPPERYASFRAFMVAMHREFHSLAVSRHGAEFANATTREQDARVEAARLDALAGAHERAEEVLAEAVAFSRPRARGLFDQLRPFGSAWPGPTFGELPHQPLFLTEVVPVLAARHVRSGQDAATWGHRLGTEPGELRTAADEVLRQVRAGGYRYAAPGPFGAAVDRAREQARWGGTDAAWRTLRAAFPRWTPLGPDHLAPVGLLADPLLGPLLSPERWCDLLATPRGDAVSRSLAVRAEPADVAEPVAEVGEGPATGDGLAWLAEVPRSSGGFGSYRFVLVEGVAPDGLPEVLGAEGAVLDPPTSRWEADAVRFRPGARNGEPGEEGGGLRVVSSEDPRPALVGHAGADGGGAWSFAFDPQTPSRPAPHLAAPAVAASGRTGGRALAVFAVPQQHFFHLCVADGGAERYGFTVRGSEITRTGPEPVPPALDPDRYFGPHASDGGQGDLLTALGADFGVGLPRFALTEGRLHSFADRSWTAPRLPGESYLTVAFGLSEEAEPSPGVS